LQILIKNEKINNLKVTSFQAAEQSDQKEIILVSDYGRTSKSYFDFAYYLICNGYNIKCIEYNNSINLDSEMSEIEKFVRSSETKIVVVDGISIFPTIICTNNFDGPIKLICFNPVKTDSAFVNKNNNYFINGCAVTREYFNEWKKYSEVDFTVNKKADITFICNSNDFENLNKIKNMKNTKYITINRNSDNIYKNPVVAFEYYSAIVDECNNFLNKNNKRIIPTYMEIISEFDKSRRS